MRNRNILSLVGALLALVLLLSSCGSKSNQEVAEYTTDVAQEAIYEDEYLEEDELYEEPLSDRLALGQISTPVERKMVETVYATLQTKTFDDGVDFLKKLTDSSGGYYAFSDIEGMYSMEETPRARTASFEIKVPVEQFEEFINQLQEQFHVVSLRQEMEDITRTYYDNEAAIKSLEERIERLNRLLDQSKDLKTILELEREMAETIQEINILYSRQEVMKSQVALSTLHITLEEVGEFQAARHRPLTYGQELGAAFRTAISGFINTLRRLSLFLVRNFPLLLFLAGIVVFAVYIAMRQKKKQDTAREEEQHRHFIEEAVIKKYGTTSEETSSEKIPDSVEEAPLPEVPSSAEEETPASPPLDSEK